ncbi:MAG: secretin N-terminal domain-containing protein [bacterium]
MGCFVGGLFPLLSAMPAAQSIQQQPITVAQVQVDSAAQVQPQLAQTKIEKSDQVLAKQLEVLQPASLKSNARIKSDSDQIKKTGQQEVKEERDIYLNFENTELSNFVNYMAELKKFNLIPDKALEGAKISLSIRDPLTLDGAYKIFLTVLEMAGFSIVQVGDVYKVIPKDKKLTEPLPSYINVPAETLPDSDITIRYVFFLQNLPTESITTLLESLLSDKHQLITQTDVNGFIITDKSLNIKSAVKLVQELDRSGQSESVVVLRLKNANATDVKELLEGLMTKKSEGGALARLFGGAAEGGLEYFPAGIKIFTIPRTNSLVMLGTAGPIKKIEDFIVNHIDTELKAVESPLHIFELQYADATQIAQILQEVTAAPESEGGAEAAKYGSIRGGVKYFKQMKFKVDKSGNRLVVSSTDKQDWKLLKKTIRDLDKPQPQVAIETLIVSVDSSNIKDIGGALRNKKEGQLGNSINFQSAAISGSPSFAPDNTNPLNLLGRMLGQVAASHGAATLTFGKNANIWGVFQALKTQTNATILSKPFLTVANKKEATISFGKEVRVSQELDPSTTAKGFTTLKADTNIKLTPQINLDGIIKMDIVLTIDDFIREDTGNKTTKNLTTQVTVADGQVLVLGGFVKTKVSDENTKTPILADIPILGWLFKKQRRDISKTYVFVFMAPTIIKPRQLPGMELYTKMKMHQVTEGIENGVETRKTRDPIFNWFFDAESENYSHKVVDFANARYQPTTVDMQNDPYYRSQTKREELKEEVAERITVPVQDKKILTQADMPVGPVSVAGADAQKVARIEPMAPVTPEKQEIMGTTPLLKQLSQKPIMQEPIYNTGQTVVDTDLDERREQLKNVLSQASITSVQSVQDGQIDKKEKLKQFISESPKREQLKKFFSQPKLENVQQEVPVQQEKRESLKKFFSEIPVKTEGSVP